MSHVPWSSCFSGTPVTPVITAKMAELIEISFAYRLFLVQVTVRWGANWRHLANMTERSVRGGDAAFCQITLTTCLY